VLFDVDFLLELQAIAHFHELVGVAGVTVLAGEFAAAIGIDGPGEGHLPVADAAIQQRLRRQREVLDLVAFAEGLAFGGQAGDADEARLFGKRKQGQGRHDIRRLFAYDRLPRAGCQEGPVGLKEFSMSPDCFRQLAGIPSLPAIRR